jgi:hypothetical protein
MTWSTANEKTPQPSSARITRRRFSSTTKSLNRARVPPLEVRWNISAPEGSATHRHSATRTLGAPSRPRVRSHSSTANPTPMVLDAMKKFIIGP